MKFTLLIDTSRDEEIIAHVHGRSPLTDELEALVLRSNSPNRIAGYDEEDVVLLEFDKLECITVQNGKTCAVDTKGKCYRLRQRLYELEPMLPSCFIRINKSALANENRIERFSASFSGAVDAVFKSGFREYVSRRCFAAIKRRYD